VKDFNQQFLTVLTKFTIGMAPSKSLAIDYYIVALIPSIGMFFKRANRDTLALNFDESETIEREISSYNHHSHSKETRLDGTLPLVKPPKKELKDIDSVVKLVKKLSNEVVDLKKNVRKEYSKPRNFGPFFKRNDNPPRPLEVPQIELNLDSFGKDNLCSYHQKNHSMKTFPQWVNSMNLVLSNKSFYANRN